ncbi:junctional sarcoplasmic reticulum protein 1 isoform X1 [Monodelphis domestica]|uniref:junctional sarcoplasmic reticulum protein 1 isoform X1 n=1 Tax=Monodelphis domestica TaxID=13616 RepID=UPI0024E1B992|nr:junctional sarcoplasmic reticulum protein 1 isoform X1 [Monodelphis domestica]XP_056678187.1 junctional sarcoplasmic reticulum protein 1 isoform X1 [Monodelphis domestica]XP_056678188.1 junctional sarcoplasmic reticulum protein 1 isoform X1 [Monodelphis domestica]XP_056678189.1 junctional sarcoplasmic reticulum protein 1 isoform X1 [Monodelphis domestica]
MATGDLEVPDRGLGCPEAMEELAMLMEKSRKQSQEEKAKGGEMAERSEEVSSQAQGPDEDGQSRAPQQAPDGIRPSKAKAEQGGPGKAATAPKSAPTRKKSKAQAQPPGKPQLRPGPLSDELPWGEITLNKCLALASVVAVLSMAFQVFQDVIDGDEEGPEAAPALWAWPGSGAPKDGGPTPPKPRDGAKTPAPPAGPKPPAKESPGAFRLGEAPPKELEPEAPEEEKAGPARAPEVAALPEDPGLGPGAERPERPSWAGSKKGSREERAEPPRRDRKEGGRRPRPPREGAEEAPRRPWEREHKHHRGRWEDSKKPPREGARNKREEQRRQEDRARFFPKQKYREGKRRD